MATAQITYDDFRKVDIRVGKVVRVEDFPEARNPSIKYHQSQTGGILSFNGIGY